MLLLLRWTYLNVAHNVCALINEFNGVNARTIESFADQITDRLVTFHLFT